MSTTQTDAAARIAEIEGEPTIDTVFARKLGAFLRAMLNTSNEGGSASGGSRELSGDDLYPLFSEEGALRSTIQGIALDTIVKNDASFPLSMRSHYGTGSVLEMAYECKNVLRVLLRCLNRVIYAAQDLDQGDPQDALRRFAEKVRSAIEQSTYFYEDRFTYEDKQVCVLDYQI